MSGAVTDDDVLGELDEQIVAMILRRAALIREHESARRVAGLPARELARETAFVRRYAARLGRHGAEVARSVLSLSRSAG
jgi:chorismate mutase